MLVHIYTDGGADPNPGIGGWAAILRAGSHERVLTGGEPRTTNNRMELQAAISALEALKYSCQVIVHTDSQYLQKALDGGIEKWRENNWQRKGKPIPNADLWKRLWELVQGHEVEWVWIRGHSGHPLNERADALARQARLSISTGRELPEGVPRLYVKASCKGNPGPGGWGAVLEAGDQTEQASGSEAKTTNNRMELLAVIEGLRMVPAGGQVLVFTTSDYVYQGATRWIIGWRQRGWRKKDGQEISNKDLWLRLNKLLEKYEIQFVSAKGDRFEESPGLLEASKLAVAIRNLH